MESDQISTQVLPAGTRLEEFVIERVLGSGGFGITYLARDTNLGRQAVIKENLPVQFCFRDPASMTVAPRHTHGDDMENFRWSLENFTREAATLASLDHPGIVRVLRSFEAFGSAYFVMPFVEGVPFDALIDDRRAKGQQFSEEELGRLLDRLLDALAHLHERGIYHRDIKPGNILITTGGAPVLIDFGSARQRLSERSMAVLESAGYTPFEQLQSRGNVGPWSDIYALGGTLAKAITFETPPKANDRAFDDPWVPLAERANLRATYSAGFLAGIDRALTMPIESRWKDADEWLAALGARKEGALSRVGDNASSAQATAEDLARMQPPGTGKSKVVAWIAAACVILCLGAAVTFHSGARAYVRQARSWEDRCAVAERERQLLIDLAALGIHKKPSDLNVDEQAVLNYYRKASDQGDANAQFNLGLCYGNGTGVAKDEVEAYKWTLLAAGQGNEGAKKNCEVFGPKLSSYERAEGQRLARKWRVRK